MKLSYYITFVVLINAYIVTTNTMQKLECEAIDIVKVRRGEGPEKIAYKAKVLKIDGECIFSAMQLKVDMGERKKGSIVCWKQADEYSEPVEISSCHFKLLEDEYLKKKEKKRLLSANT